MPWHFLLVFNSMAKISKILVGSKSDLMNIAVYNNKINLLHTVSCFSRQSRHHFDGLNLSARQCASPFSPFLLHCLPPSVSSRPKETRNFQCVGGKKENLWNNIKLNGHSSLHKRCLLSWKFVFAQQFEGFSVNFVWCVCVVCGSRRALEMQLKTRKLKLRDSIKFTAVHCF